MGDIVNITGRVKPSFEPKPDEALVGSISGGLLKVYVSKERVLVMFADPKDPGNPERRMGLRFSREQASDVANLLREAVLTIRAI